MKKQKILGLIILLIIMLTGLTGCFFSEDKHEISDEKPTNSEIMAYAQTVLDDNLNNPSYSRIEKDYNIMNNGDSLRYKIEGKVNGEKFWMIIEFVDDTYKEYDLISLQVGNEYIYKK